LVERGLVPPPPAGRAGLHSGVLIVVQRFRADLGLYVHLHALVPDGCFRAIARDVELLPVRALCESLLRSVITCLHHDLTDDEAARGEPTEELDESLSTCPSALGGHVSLASSSTPSQPTPLPCSYPRSTRT
jgi:hypothetical protein